MQSPVLSKSVNLQTSTNRRATIVPILEASQQGHIRNGPSTHCLARPLLLFREGRTCERAEDNVAQPRPGGSCAHAVSETSFHSTAISPLDAPDQRHLSRILMSVLPIVNRCRIVRVSARDPAGTRHLQSVSPTTPRLSLNASTSGGTEMSFMRSIDRQPSAYVQSSRIALSRRF